MNAEVETTNAGSTTRLNPLGIVKFLLTAALVALLALEAHAVLGSAEPEAEAASEDYGLDGDYFPPEYAFRAMDFDDPVKPY